MLIRRPPTEIHEPAPEEPSGTTVEPEDAENPAAEHGPEDPEAQVHANRLQAVRESAEKELRHARIAAIPFVASALYLLCVISNDFYRANDHAQDLKRAGYEVDTGRGPLFIKFGGDTKVKHKGLEDAPLIGKLPYADKLFVPVPFFSEVVVTPNYCPAGTTFGAGHNVTGGYITVDDEQGRTHRLRPDQMDRACPIPFEELPVVPLQTTTTVSPPTVSVPGQN